jgi:short-subunit dehydrogenase
MTRSADGPRPWRRDIAGAAVIVTGASSGVGRAVALEFAVRGANVLATARRGDRLVALAEEAVQRGLRPILHEAGDITLPGFRRQLVAAAVERLGGVDILVAAAGSGAVGPFRDASPDTLARILDVDFVAPAELVRTALPSLLRSHDPGIVLVGSILGCHPLPLHAEYCAAKAAIRSLAGCLRLELSADGVDVLLATLGPTSSEFWDSLLAGRRADWSRGRALSAERTARIMMRALVRRRREVLPGWRAKAFAWTARLAPGIIDRALARRTRRHTP